MPTSVVDHDARPTSSRCAARSGCSRRSPAREAFRVDGDHDAVVANAERFVPTLVARVRSRRRARRRADRDAPSPSAIAGRSSPRPPASASAPSSAAHRARRRRSAAPRAPAQPRAGPPRRRRRRRRTPRPRPASCSPPPSGASSSTASASCARPRQVAERLGNMKGALMKLGQMASYLDEGLPEPLREALSQLQSNAPPMSGRARRRGRSSASSARPPERAVRRVGPAADRRRRRSARSTGPSSSTRTPGVERAVAVKVQYPGVGDAIEADLRNADLLGTLLRAGLRRPRPDRDGRRDQGAHHRGARLPARGAQPAALRRLLPRPPVHPRARRCCRRCRPAGCSPPSWSPASTWKEVLDVGPGPARPRRRVPVPVRVPQPLRDARVQRRPAPRQLPVPRRRARSRSSTSGSSSTSPTPRWRRSSSMVRGRRVRPRRRRVPPHRRGRRACCAPARRSTDAEVGEYFSQFYETVRARPRRSRGRSEYASGIVRHTFDRTSPIAQYATVPRRVRVHPADQPRAVRAARRAAAPPATTGASPRSCGRSSSGPPSTPMAEREQAWLRGVTRRS